MRMKPWPLLPGEKHSYVVSHLVSFMDLALVVCSLQVLISLASSSNRGDHWQLGLFHVGKEEGFLSLAPFCRL